jgi:hypothetical protein
MRDKAKAERSPGTSYVEHGAERTSVRTLLRRKMLQKELARRGHRAAEAIALFRRAH